MKTKRLLALLCVAVMSCMVLASCGMAASDSAAIDMDMYANTKAYYGGKGVPMEEGEYFEGGMNMLYSDEESPKLDIETTAASYTTSAASRAEFEEKLIKNVSLHAETREYDDAVKALDGAISRFGGYVESSSSNGRSLDYATDAYYRRSADFTIRIPAAQLESFLAEAGTIFNITYNHTNVTNITSEYYDVKTRIEVLETERDSLTEMLEQAKDVETMLKIKGQLYQVIYEIESYQTRLKMYDSQVSYSTVNLTVEEVVEYTRVTEKATWGQRLANAFKDSWKDFGRGFQSFTVDFLYAIPTILVLIVIGVALFFLIRFIVRKANAATKKNYDPSHPGSWRRPVNRGGNGNGDGNSNGNEN